VLASAGNAPALEQFRGPILRSFEKPSGRRWLLDIWKQLIPIEIEEKPAFKVFPDRDPRLMLVVRKIIRELCHFHGLGTAIADDRVFARVLRWQILPLSHKYHGRGEKNG
jgi:hypothetical protein